MIVAIPWRLDFDHLFAEPTSNTEVDAVDLVTVTREVHHAQIADVCDFCHFILTSKGRV